MNPTYVKKQSARRRKRETPSYQDLLEKFGGLVFLLNHRNQDKKEEELVHPRKDGKREEFSRCREKFKKEREQNLFSEGEWRKTRPLQKPFFPINPGSGMRRYEIALAKYERKMKERGYL
jgi:hypothetical protein